MDSKVPERIKEMKPINVLLIVPDRTDATSLYRSMGPFANLRKQINITLMVVGGIDWSVLRMSDFVFMQRPFNNEHRKIAELCKAWSTPLWVDFDDLLFDIPTDNPAYGHYMTQEIRSNIVAITKMATVVTTSTLQLKKVLQLAKNCLNERVYVVENALDDCFVHLKRVFQYKKHINWRGSNTHVRDLTEHAREIIELARERKDATFTFIGYNPWFLTDAMRKDQAIVAAPMQIGDYFQFISKTNPSIQIVPLDRSMFNMCKSNIGWIEGTLAGAACVGPDFDEWMVPGCSNYSTPEEFKQKVEFLLDNPGKARELHDESWEYIKNNLLLSHVNKKRINIIMSLKALADGKDPNWMEGFQRVEDHVMELA
jgi:hypothetical protein